MENEAFENYAPIDIKNYDLETFSSVVRLLKKLNEENPTNKYEILSEIEKIWEHRRDTKGETITKATSSLRKGVPLDNTLIEYLDELAF